MGSIALCSLFETLTFGPIVSFRNLILIPAVASMLAVAVRAQDSKPRPGVAPAAGGLGAQPYRRGKWGVMRTGVTNPTDRDGSIEILTNLRIRSDRQFGRRLWVPAHSRRTSWYPFYFPRDLDPELKQVDANSVVWDRSDGGRELLRNSGNRRLHDSVFRLRDDQPVTAVIPDAGSHPRGVVALHAVTALRIHRFRERRLAAFNEHLPMIVEALDGVDHLVIYNDRIADNIASQAAVRQWVQRGGRLWIMVDAVKPSTIGALLGDAQPFQEVDRVDLTEFRIETTGTRRAKNPPPQREFEQPVRFVRVLAENVDVIHHVNGWPVSFWRAFGKGGVLFTTLGMRGWLRKPNQRETIFEKNRLYVAPTESLVRATERLLQYAPKPLDHAEVFDEYLAGQIGYKTASRNTVASILGGFCAALLCATIWLGRRRKLDRMLWFGPAAAVVATGALVAIGRQSRRSVEETVAVLQHVVVEPDSEEIVTRGRLAVYSHDRSRKDVASNNAGRLDLEFAEEPGTTRRMIWTDFNAWSWADTAIPAGIQTTNFEYRQSAGRNIVATATLGPNGLTGQVRTGPFQNPADAVIFGRTRFPLTVQLDADGNITPNDRRSVDESSFISGALLTDEQRRRQALYRRFLGERERKRRPARPKLFVWADPLPMQFQFGDAVQVGSALLEVPLKFKTSPPGTRVKIPPVFLPFRTANSFGGKIYRSAYNNVGEEWLERDVPTDTWLQVQLPREVMPLNVEKVIATVRFKTAQRPFQVAGVVDGKPVVLADVQEPLATTRVEVDRVEALPIDADGRLLIGIHVGGEKTPGRFWQFASVRIQVEGTVGKSD